MKTKFIVWGLFTILSVSSASAQNGMSLGIGGYTAIARGVEAIYWNPANLAVIDKNDPRLEMLIYSLNAGVGNNAFNMNTINQYMGDGESIDLNDNDIENILSKIDDDNGLQFDFASNIAAFSFRYKHVGFGIESHTYGHITIPKAIYKNALTGIGQEYYDYSVASEAVTVGKIKLSYGRTVLSDRVLNIGVKRFEFKEIAVGVSFVYLHGMGYGEIEKGTATIDIANDGILPTVDFQTKYALLGDGFGMDIGFGAFTEDQWSFGLTFENVFAPINWTVGNKRSTATIDFGAEHLFIFGDDQLESIDIDSVSTDTTVDIDPFSTRLPFDFRMGVAKQFGNYLLNVELANENKMTQFAIGGKIKLSFLHWAVSWRRFANNNHWSTGFSFDFKHFYFDVGIASRNGFSLMGAKGLFLGSSLCFGF